MNGSVQPGRLLDVLRYLNAAVGLLNSNLSISTTELYDSNGDPIDEDGDGVCDVAQTICIQGVTHDGRAVVASGTSADEACLDILRQTARGEQ